MFDPLKSLNDKVAEIKADVKKDVEILLLRENVKFILSRLQVVDTDNSSKYSSALTELNL